MDQRLSRRALTVTTGALALTLGRAARADELASPEASPSPQPDLIPDSPAGRQLAWVVGVMNGDLPIPDETGITERFATVVLDQVPAAALIDTFRELKAQFAPVTVDQIVGIPTPLAINAVISTGSGAQFVVSVTVEDEAPHRMTGLLFSPYNAEMPEIPEISSWPELDTLLAESGARASVHAASVTGDSAFAPIHELRSEAIMAIGSVFKLYVLGALAEAIEAGRLEWSDEIELTDELRSLPSGVTQDELSGTRLRIDELARRMISISDNTATDLLMAAVGREACEAALVAMGNSAPERTIPFLTTREMFIIKFGDPEFLEQFAAASSNERRTLLRKRVIDQPLPSLDKALEWSSPIAIESIEWFASMVDLGRAMVWLWDASDRSALEPIKEILTINAGFPVDEAVWPVVAFKGGSEVGVLAVSWYLERADGERMVFAAAVNDPDAAISEDGVILPIIGAFSLLADA